MPACSGGKTKKPSGRAFHSHLMGWVPFSEQVSCQGNASTFTLRRFLFVCVGFWFFFVLRGVICGVRMGNGAVWERFQQDLNLLGVYLGWLGGFAVPHLQPQGLTAGFRCSPHEETSLERTWKFLRIPWDSAVGSAWKLGLMWSLLWGAPGGLNTPSSPSFPQQALGAPGRAQSLPCEGDTGQPRVPTSLMQVPREGRGSFSTFRAPARA